MTAEIDMRQGTESSIAMRVDEAPPQQTFAQIDVFIAPSPIVVGKAVSRREVSVVQYRHGCRENSLRARTRWPAQLPFRGGADASNSAALIAGGFNTAIPSAKMLAYPESQQDFWWHGSG